MLKRWRQTLEKLRLRASGNPDGYVMGLSFRLLLFTILFVMIAEVLIFFPTAASFRTDWLQQRLEAAVTASLAVEAAPDRMVSNELTAELLMYAEVQAIGQRRDGIRELDNPLPRWWRRP